MLERALAEKDAENAKLSLEVAALHKQVEVLTAQVEALTARLARNSGNSNQPPSSDGPGGAKRKRRKKSAKGKSRRKRGGQPGHRGAHRALVAAEEVDEVKDLYPHECTNCWAKLEQTPDARPRHYQCVEVPPPKPHTTEYRRHAVVCKKCGHKTRAGMANDEVEIPASPFGPRLTSIVTMLTGAYHVSRRKAVKLIFDLLGVKVSLGAVSAMEGRVSEALAQAAHEVDARLERDTVKHTDGTTWLTCGHSMSLWTIASKMATAYKIVKTGSKAQLQPLFGRLKGILVSDRAKALNFWAMERRQICWAHLLRKFVSFSERAGPAGVLGQSLLACAELAFHYWHALKDGRLSAKAFRYLMRLLQERFKVQLVKARDSKLKELSGSCSDILKHESALWTYVDNANVEPTNNHAERELRGFVLWRKCSFGSQSERGNRFAERIMTVTHTARKQKIALLPFLTASNVAWQTGADAPSLFAADSVGAV